MKINVATDDMTPRCMKGGEREHARECRTKCFSDEMKCDQDFEVSLSAQVSSMQNLNHCEMMKKLAMEMEACEAQVENRTTGLCLSVSSYYSTLTLSAS